MATNDIWGITTYFNPAKYKSKKENYLTFRQESKRNGLNLLCVELAFNDANYELTKNDADIMIYVKAKGNSIMWQKERLLNIGLKKLPRECKKIIWIDCDILFENKNWVTETAKLLDNYYIIQPFKNAYKLTCEEKFPVDITNRAVGGNNGEKLPSFAYVVTNEGFSTDKYCGHKGYCWAGRRELFDKIGFYDAAILGEGDSVMAHAFIGVPVTGYTEKLPPKCKAHQILWAEKAFNIVNNSIYYMNYNIFHLYHGESKNRLYREKCLHYALNDFDPDTDIRINPHNLVWEWSSDKLKLHQFMFEYFYQRKED
ncbi:hypothetical protein [Propionispora vibrioides]|uniref:Glycosyl transferase family 2 n=1 Tax=Propionispora vibrioides TaxID=112903 RepID=A0A1H8XLZ0_9FIRM|nr:hypothetical protein [Propionispora vibrioides]SEP40939.1 hypothetical protein SAMN04490178_1265 [Propionispora vibrioides]